MKIYPRHPRNPRSIPLLVAALSRCAFALRILFQWSRPGQRRQHNLKRRAVIRLAHDADRAAMFLDDAPRDRQAQAGAAFFRGEKRVKQAGKMFRRNADPGVLNSNAQLPWVGGSTMAPARVER